MATSKTINGDCLEELKKLDDNSIDLLCTDPPYGYGFMGKHWDTFQEKQSTESQTVGWMSPGMKKSTYGMKEFFVPIWEESLRVVKPGGFAFVMSAPRSDVQMVMVQTLQEAGFDVSFTPIYWTYATGFPKAMNMGKAVDKRLGAEREVVGKYKTPEGGQELSTYNNWKDGENQERRTPDITEPKSDEAKKLDGSYAGYQPKPAVEVVIVAMKPLEQKGYLDQALDNQKGITWLDDCRIPFQSEDEHWEQPKGVEWSPEREWNSEHKRESSPLGRFAANLLVSDDTLEEDFSRYYSLDAWWEDRLQKLPNEVKRTFPFLIVPKASKSEKNDGLEKFEKQEKIFNGQSDKPSTDMKGVEKKFTTQPSQNIHPTVKPTTLMSYLVTLGSRKGDVVLDPFGGSGTTAISCVFSERNYILIEREKEYYEILKARIKKAENPAGLVINEWF